LPPPSALAGEFSLQCMAELAVDIEQV
jgi:hypothetical protein